MGKRGRPRHPDVLTPREWEVLGLVREGMTNEAIGERLGISLDGVKYHVSEILGKLDVENRADAARWQPEARRWWAIAPIGLLRARWLSPPIAAGLALVVLAAIGVLVWALVATRGGERIAVPVALAAGDKLAYVGEDGNLWLLEGGVPARRLTEGTELVSSAPQWSPNGRYILFLQTPRVPPGAKIIIVRPSLFLADTLTGEVRQIDDDYESLYVSLVATWSPDSRHISFVSQTVGALNATLFVGDLDGNAQRVAPLDFGVSELAWSPDGTKLVIARTLEVVYPEDPRAAGARAAIPDENGVYIVDATGGEPRPLVLREAVQSAYEAGEAQAGIENGLAQLGVTGAGGLAWSPDGEYVSFQASVLSAAASADGEALFSVPAAGGAPVYHGMMLRSTALLDWFPNSHRFAFTLGQGRDAYIYKCLALAEAGVPGARVPQDRCAAQSRGITPDLSVRTDGWPAVSPDGSRIAFQSSEPSNDVIRLDIGKVEGPREGIWVADADGSNERQLTSDPEYLDFFPRWSADGKLIMFLRLKVAPTPPGATPDYLQPANAEVWLMRADGSGGRSIVTDAQRIPSYYGLFEWENAVAWWPSTDGG